MPVTTMLQHIIKVACTLYLLIFCILCYYFEHFFNGVFHFVVHPSAVFNSFLLLSFDASLIDFFFGACDGDRIKQFQQVCLIISF
jgi:hypothetical protein